MNERIPPRRHTTRLAPALLLPLALLLIALLPAGAQADPIVLTSGAITVDRAAKRASVLLVGPNFTVRFSTDLQFHPGSFPHGGFRTDTFACGCDGFGFAAFDGYETQNILGGGRYDANVIIGRISLYAGIPGGPPVFTVDFVGAGFIESDTSTFTRFVITGGTPSLVPEPATLLLLGSGLAGVAVRARKRRRGGKTAEESPPV